MPRGYGGYGGYVPGGTPPGPNVRAPGPYRPPPSPYKPPTPPPTGAPPTSAPPPPHNPYRPPPPVSSPTGLQPVSPLPGITHGPQPGPLQPGPLQPGPLQPVSPIGRIGGGSAYNLPPPVSQQMQQFPIRQPMYLPPSARNAPPPVSIAPGTGPYGPVLGPTLIRR
jgi:hypothetical protein